MEKQKLIISVVVILVATLVISLFTFQEQIAEQLLRNTIIRNLQAQQTTAEALQQTDKITVVLCGVGSSLAQTAPQTCTAVFINGQFLLFDAGDGARASIQASNLPLDELDAVFITHYHNDHYADLGEVMEWSWIFGRRHILPIHGPAGITQIVDAFQSAYELEESYRTAHHGAEIMPPEWSPSEAVEFPPPEGDTAIIVYEQDGVVVKAFRVSHPPVEPSAGYRIEYADKVIVISGDTVYTSSLLVNSQDADLLVAEAMNKTIVQFLESVNAEIGNNVNATLLFDIRDYHMDVSEVGKLAQEANVQRLALNHLAPKPQSNWQANRFFRNPIAEFFTGELFVGEDGMQIIIPLP